VWVIPSLGHAASGPGSAPVPLTILLDRSFYWVFRASFVSNVNTDTLPLSIYLFTFVHWPEGFVGLFIT